MSDFKRKTYEDWLDEIIDEDTIGGPIRRGDTMNLTARITSKIIWDEAVKSVQAIPDTLVLLPKQLLEQELTTAQGVLLDCSWDAVTCFEARLHELYRITRSRVDLLLDKPLKG